MLIHHCQIAGLCLKDLNFPYLGILLAEASPRAQLFGSLRPLKSLSLSNPSSRNILYNNFWIIIRWKQCPTTMPLSLLEPIWSYFGLLSPESSFLVRIVSLLCVCT